MNQVVYEQPRKKLFMFVCLVNKPSSNPTLGLIIKPTKLKYNNVLVNKLINMKAWINYIRILVKKYIYIYLKFGCIIL